MYRLGRPASSTTRALRVAAVVVSSVAVGALGWASTAASGGGATTYYVDAVSGNDAAAGTSSTSAWRSLGRASRVVLRPGDRLLLRRGATWTGSLAVRGSSAGRRRIVVGAYGRGARPLLRGGATCVHVLGSFVRVTELRVAGCTWAGISLAGDSDIVDHSLISGSAAGIELEPGSHAARIQFNDLVDNDRMSVLTRTPTDDDSGAFGILIRGDGAYVANNRISGSDAFSYDYGRDGSAIEIYGGRANVVEYNTAVDDHAFTELGDARSAGNTFAYNLFATSTADATFVVTRGAKDSRGPVRGTRLYNNTADLTGAGSQGVVCYAGCSADVLTMRNNVVVARLKAVYADAPFDEDADVFSGGRVQAAVGPHTLAADPRFVSAGAADFRLLPSSPAIDRGVRLGFRHDLAGTPVPLDGTGDGRAAPDAGAFEYCRPGSGRCGAR